MQFKDNCEKFAVMFIQNIHILILHECAKKFFLTLLVYYFNYIIFIQTKF